MKRTITDFTNSEYTEQARNKLHSSICNIMSGLKLTANKAVYSICIKRNITKWEKNEVLGNLIALDTDYHGGATNIPPVVCNNAIDYVGTNNLTLIDKKGDLGGRLNHTMSAFRYNFGRKHSIFDKVFKKDDCNVLPRYTSDNELIEYQFLPFIIPMILVNGAEGMGSGHAQKIFPREVKTLVKYIFQYLDNATLPEIPVHFNNYKGTVSQGESNKQWITTGVFQRVNKTKTLILEVPVYETYISFIKKLDLLVEKSVIKSYVDLCDPKTDTFEFTIRHDRTFGECTDEVMIKKLKISTPMTENYTMIDENNKLIVYDTAEQIINHYCKIRLEYYVKRKDYLIKQMQSDIDILSWKRMFVSSVSNGSFDITKKNKKQLEDALYDMSFPKYNKTYSYLTDMKIHNLTTEKIEEMTIKIDNMIVELKVYKDKEVSTMWKEELNELMSAIGERRLNVKSPIPTEVDTQIDSVKTKVKTDIINSMKVDMNNLF